MSKVYLISEPFGPRDLSSADRYGAIEYMLTQKDQASLAPGPALAKLRKSIREMGPDDYITFAGGDPIAPLLAGIAVGSDPAIRDLTWLRWERSRTGSERTGGGFYVPVQFLTREK